MKRFAPFGFQPLLILLACLLLTTACHHAQPSKADAWTMYDAKQRDSLSFQAKHHYTNNYNFLVKADSFPLVRQQPEEAHADLPLDTIYVYRNNHLVVADIRIVPSDQVDSVWIQVARDQATFGWTHERNLLKMWCLTIPSHNLSRFSPTCICCCRS